MNTKPINKFGILSDLFDGQCTLLISPGDILDRITILSIQIKKNFSNLEHIHDELQRALVLFDRIIEYYPDVDQALINKLSKRLKIINSARLSCKHNMFSYLVHSKKYRKLEIERSEIKNKINILFKYPVQKG